MKTEVEFTWGSRRAWVLNAILAALIIGGLLFTWGCAS